MAQEWRDRTYEKIGAKNTRDSTMNFRNNFTHAVEVFTFQLDINFTMWPPLWIAKLVSNSNNYGLWYS